VSLRAFPRDARSLRQLVVKQLRDAIVQGELAPGTRLLEEELSQRFEVSRGPVREALRQLEQEGLVASFPYRGSEVLGVSEEEVHRVLIPIRLSIEQFCFPRAMHAMNQAAVEALGNVIEEMRRGAADGDLKRVVEADIRFHQLVLENAGLPHALQIWLAIEPRIRAYFHRHGRRQDLNQIVAEHRQLFEALRDHEEQSLVGLLEEHIVVDWHEETA
jgi:DNA-binding GntR family transcriptional regulator